jgi:putative ABC transport system permease protein
MDSFLQDIRYAIRTLVRTPGFTVVAVLALGLGIGANTAIFTVVNAALIEPLPFRDPNRIIALWEESARAPGRNNTISPANFIQWSERATAFETMAAMVDTRSNLTGDGDPEEVTVQNVTAQFFPLLGVTPLIGRPFTDAENRDPQAAVVILGYDFWQRRFGGDRGVMGRTIRLNGRPNTIVGVMPQGFQLFIKSRSLAGKPSDLWTPYVFNAEARTWSGRFLEAIGRLKSGTSVEAAQTQLTTIASALAVEFPQRNANWGARVVPLRAELSDEYRRALLILTGAVAFVLLIVCANVANLLLARGAARRREFAIRAAVGAARARVVRQLLTEGLVLASAGGVLGLLAAGWGIELLLALSPVDLSTSGPVRLNGVVLAFSAAVSIATAVVCGLAPAFAGTRVDAHDALSDARQVGASVPHRRLRQAFVVAEIALASVLLVGAGLLMRSFVALRQIDPGYSTNNVLTLRLQLPATKYPEDEQRIRFFHAAADQIRQLPGVQAVGAISFLPLTSIGAGTSFTTEGRPAPPPGQNNNTGVSVCDNGFFAAMNIPLKRGRFFSEREMREKSNVVIVSESLVRTYFADEDPIGKHLTIAMTRPNVPTEVIGVVGDLKFEDLKAQPQPTSYWPHPQLAYSSMTLTVRTAGEPLALAPVVERTIRALDKDQPVSDVRTMNQWVARSLARARFSSMLLTAFAAVALLLSAIGIYGVLSYAVSQRTSEIGIRLALGAETKDIVRMVVGNGLRLTLLGLSIGAALALALSRTLAGLLYETTASDPITFAAVMLTLGTIAALASYVPARRASRIPPVEALRYQ